MAIETRHLRLAACLREAGSLNRAAAERGITQPTASRMLGEIERHLGIQLLERTPRGSKLTSAGEAFAQHAAGTLASFDALLDSSRWQQQTLTIAYAWGGLESVLSEAVTQRHQDPSRGRCQLQQRSDPLRSLESGASDLALVRGPADAPLLSSCVLYTEPRVVVLPVDSPVVDLPCISPADLGQLKLVVNVDSGTTGRVWAGRPNESKVTEVHGVDEWMVSVAGHPRRFGVTPESTMSFYTHPRIVVRPISGLSDLPVRLVWRRDESRRSIHEFIAAVKNAA